MATLTNPGTLEFNDFNTFTAQPVITLAAEHDLLANRERGNLIRQDACVDPHQKMTKTGEFGTGASATAAYIELSETNQLVRLNQFPVDKNQGHHLLRREAERLRWRARTAARPLR